VFSQNAEMPSVFAYTAGGGKKVFFRGALQLVLSSGAYMRPEYDACGLNRRNMLIIKEDGL